MERLTRKINRQYLCRIDKETEIQVERDIDYVETTTNPQINVVAGDWYAKSSIIDRLGEFEDFMEEQDFKSLNDLKKALGKQFEIKQNPRHLGREINGVYFTNEQCYILSQFSEFNTSYLKKYEDIKQENQELKDRWQKLKEWVEDDDVRFSHEYANQSSDTVIKQYEILTKMQELEKE